jgi:hypothetical protein
MEHLFITPLDSTLSDAVAGSTEVPGNEATADGSGLGPMNFRLTNAVSATALISAAYNHRHPRQRAQGLKSISQGATTAARSSQETISDPFITATVPAVVRILAPMLYAITPAVLPCSG